MSQGLWFSICYELDTCLNTYETLYVLPHLWSKLLLLHWLLPEMWAYKTCSPSYSSMRTFFPPPCIYSFIVTIFKKFWHLVDVHLLTKQTYEFSISWELILMESVHLAIYPPLLSFFLFLSFLTIIWFLTLSENFWSFVSYFCGQISRNIIQNFWLIQK